jgi:hypothetical protein
MNWNTVKGQPGKYVQLWAAVAEIKHFSGEYGPYALGKATDRDGYVEDVFFTIAKGKQFPTGLRSGHQCNWAGKYDANSGKTKLFFDSMAQVDVSPQAPQTPPPQALPQQPPPQAPPQSAPQPPQAPMAPQGTRDATGVSIERQACYKGTCELAARRADLIPDRAAFFDMLFHGHKWIETGNVDPMAISSLMPVGSANWDQDQAPPDPNQDDSDLPEALRANYQPPRQ